MTQRTEHRLSPIELATAQVIDRLNAAITEAWHDYFPTHAATGGLPYEPGFRRTVALYLASQSDEQMCQKLNAPPPESAVTP